MESEKDIEVIVKAVADAMTYYRISVSSTVLSTWVDCLKQYNAEDVAKAIRKHIAGPDTGKFPVTISDVVRILEGSTGERAALAWGKVYSAMSDVGAYTDVVFDEAAIHAAIEDLGGWPILCRGLTADLPFVQKRFGDAYRAYLAQVTFAYPRKLSGDRGPDEDFVAKGLKPPAPVVIGDVDKAREVYSGGLSHGRITAAPTEVLSYVQEAQR